MRSSTPDSTGSPGETVCTVAQHQHSRHGHADRLARTILHVDEEPEYWSIADPRRRAGYRASRLAVKDAVRLWWQRRGIESLHPAAIRIDHDEQGRPFVSQDGQSVLPWISLTHSGGTAAAVASDEEVGIDLEPIEPSRDDLLSYFASENEQLLLAELAAKSPENAWETRLWCAKEAAAKRLGAGLQGRPKDYTLEAADLDGTLWIAHPDAPDPLAVHTFPDNDHIIAIARQPAPIPAAADHAEATR